MGKYFKNTSERFAADPPSLRIPKEKNLDPRQTTLFKRIVKDYENFVPDEIKSIFRGSDDTDIKKIMIRLVDAYEPTKKETILNKTGFVTLLGGLSSLGVSVATKAAAAGYGGNVFTQVLQSLAAYFSIVALAGTTPYLIYKIVARTSKSTANFLKMINQHDFIIEHYKIIRGFNNQDQLMEIPKRQTPIIKKLKDLLAFFERFNISVKPLVTELEGKKLCWIQSEGESSDMYGVKPEDLELILNLGKQLEMIMKAVAAAMGTTAIGTAAGIYAWWSAGKGASKVHENSPNFDPTKPGSSKQIPATRLSPPKDLGAIKFTPADN